MVAVRLPPGAQLWLRVTHDALRPAAPPTPSCPPRPARLPRPHSELLLVGGGSKNSLWRRVVADAFQLPLRFPAEPEAAALGAALQVQGPRRCGCSAAAAAGALQRACAVSGLERVLLLLPLLLLNVAAKMAASATPDVLPPQRLSHLPPVGRRRPPCTRAPRWRITSRRTRRPWVRLGLPQAGLLLLLLPVSVMLHQSCLMLRCCCRCNLTCQPLRSTAARPLVLLAEEEVMQPHPAAAAAYADAFSRHQRWGGLLYGGGSAEV